MRTTLLSIGSAIVAASLLPRTAAAGETAAEIARRARDQGSLSMVDSRADLSMITVDKSGTTKERRLVASVKKIGGRVHTLLRFKSPPDIAGVALLAIEGQGGAPDDISLFLPKIKRTRKIAAGQRGQSFMDSDFAYADFSGEGAVNEGDAARLDDEKLDGVDCFVLSGKPPADSPYAKVKAWVEKTTSVVRRLELYGPDGALKKRLTVTKVGPLGGRTLAVESTMETLATGTRTTVMVHSLEAGTFSDEAFTERGLERG
jgi:hypothetical protein